MPVNESLTRQEELIIMRRVELRHNANAVQLREFYFVPGETDEIQLICGSIKFASSEIG